MWTINIDGLSTPELAFLAGKFNRAIKREHKKTVAARNFDGIPRYKIGNIGHKRAVVEEQIVHESNIAMCNWSLTMMDVEEDQKMPEAKLAGAGDDDQDSGCFDDGSWFDDGCRECGRFNCDCHLVERDCGDSCSYYADDSGDDDDDDTIEFWDLFPTFRRDLKTLMTLEEEAMKLSDELWRDHEFYFGTNNLRTMSRTLDDAYGSMDTGGYWDFGAEFLAYDDKPVDEFGGLPNHFLTNHRDNIKREAEPHPIDQFTVWLNEMLELETDFKLRLNPMKARRASRFSEIAGGNIKRVGRRHGGARFNWNNWKSWIAEEHEDRQEKIANQRSLRLALDEVFGVEPKKGRKLRFRSREEMEKYEKSLCAATKRDTAQSDNVDYSLPVRRMVICKVQVTRVTNVNGRTRILSSSLENMLCRRR
jgi:hypothetical protein